MLPEKQADMRSADIKILLYDCGIEAFGTVLFDICHYVSDYRGHKIHSVFSGEMTVFVDEQKQKLRIGVDGYIVAVAGIFERLVYLSGVMAELFKVFLRKVYRLMRF